MVEPRPGRKEFEAGLSELGAAFADQLDAVAADAALLELGDERGRALRRRRRR